MKRPIFISYKTLLVIFFSACFAAASVSAADYKVATIMLDENNPERTSVGRLLWRGGIVLDGNDSRFGGLSALHVSEDGKRMFAISDRGNWLSASLEYRDGDIVNVREFEIGPLLGRKGGRVRGREADAESLALLDDDEFIVSFERRHRLWRYKSHPDRSLSRPVPLNAPAGLRDLSDNGGIEAMTRLCGGRLVVVAEKSTDRRKNVGGWIQSDAGWSPFHYQTKAALLPTGAATLPNCDVIFVERSFSLIAGLDIRLSRVRASAIHANAIVEPEELAHLSGTLTIDNFEGISARRGENGETLIYLLSDDNFSSLQRTLLVMFELDETP